MSDIEERLKRYVAAIVCADSDLRVGPAMCANAMSEAADEIARLRAEIADMNAARDMQRASIRPDAGRPA